MINKNDFKFYLEKKLLNNPVKKEKWIENGCLEIIDYISSANQHCNGNLIDNSILSRKFSFDDFRKSVSNEISNNDFILIVFYLCQPNIEILQQRFSAFNPNSSQYEDLDDVQIQNLIDMLQSKCYQNPITGENLIPQQFAQQVITYFVLSDEVKRFVLEFND